MKGRLKRSGHGGLVRWGRTTDGTRWGDRAVAEEEAHKSSAGQWRDRYGDDITQMLFLNLFMMGTSSK